jgi:hypothetical protein
VHDANGITDFVLFPVEIRVVIEIKAHDNCISFTVTNMIDRSDERCISGNFPDVTPVLTISVRAVLMAFRERAKWGEPALSIS